MAKLEVKSYMTGAPVSIESDASALTTVSPDDGRPNINCRSRVRRTVSLSDSDALTISAMLLPSIRVCEGLDVASDIRP